MSWEAWGSGPEPFDVEVLYNHGWESDPDCEKWWKSDEPERIYTLIQAIESYQDWMFAKD